MSFVVVVAAAGAPALAGPLPFADGTYVTDLALCRMTDRQRADRHGYDVIEMVKHIEGSRLTDGYALNCTVLSARTNGSIIRYRTRCNVEGVSETSTGAMTRLSDTSFRIGNLTFRACGRLAR